MGKDAFEKEWRDKEKKLIEDEKALNKNIKKCEEYMAEEHV